MRLALGVVVGAGLVIAAWLCWRSALSWALSRGD